MRRLAPLLALAFAGCVASITVTGTVTLDGEPAPGWLVVLGAENSPIVYGDSFTDAEGSYRLKFTNLRGCELYVAVYPPEQLAPNVVNDEGGVALLDCGDHRVDLAYRTVVQEPR